MKRIFSLMLAVALILCTVLSCSVSADAMTDSSEYKIDFLQRLGISEKIDASSYNANVTREDFAYFVSKANGFSSDNEYDRRYFIDVPSDSYAFTEIQNLAKAGIISGDGNSEFRSDESVTYAEAIVMILNSMGYKNMCAAKGGFPYGYIEEARRLKLSVKNPDDKLTYVESMNLMYDALKCNVCDVTTVSGDNIDYSRNGETWLKVSFGLDFAEGSVEAVYGRALYSDKTVDKKNVLISGKYYTVLPEFDEQDFIANYVTYFYNDKTNEICFMCIENVSKEDISFDTADYVGFDGNQLKYYTDSESGREKSVGLESEFVIIYNGMPLTNDIDGTMQALKTGKGTVEVKDSDNNGNYDVVIVENYRGFLLGSVNSEKQIIYNKMYSGDNIDVGSKDYVYIKRGNTEISFNELETNTYLDIAESINKDAIKIIVSETVLESKISAIIDDKVTIDGKTYDVCDEYLDYFKENAKIGIKYRIYTDSFGKIGYVDASQNRKMTYGYLIKSSIGDDFDETVRLKVFAEDGQIHIYPLSDKIEIDAVSFKGQSAEDKVKYFKGKRQLIEYMLNSKGEITYIDTARVKNENEDADYSLRSVYENTTAAQWHQRGRFGVNALFGAPTVTFYIPDREDAEDKYYSVGSYSKIFPEETVKAAEVYYKSDNSDFIDVMIKKMSTDTKQEIAGVVMMIDSASETLNADGENILEISGYDGTGTEQKVQIEPDKCVTNITDENGQKISADLKKGDLIIGWISEMSSSEYLEVEKVFDAGRQDTPTNFIDNGANSLLYQIYRTYAQNTGYYADTQLSFGFVSKVFDNGVVSWGINCDGIESERAATTNRKIAIYDAKTEKISIGDYSQIKDYVTAKDGCSRIFYHTSKGAYKGMFVYNK